MDRIYQEDADYIRFLEAKIMDLEEQAKDLRAEYDHLFDQMERETR